MSTDLSFEISFYQNGIARVLIEEPNSGRFRISEEGLPVSDDQLFYVTDLADKISITPTQITINLPGSVLNESFKYIIQR